jgi:3(or 17)beta-hydroxysteroid dehydrogenase
MRLAGKIALVTGGASGLGRATALALAREGARVMISDVNEEGGRAVVREIGDAARFVLHDVRDEASWATAIAGVESAFGGLHALVNNAGIVALGTVEETSLEQWRRVMAVNADGIFLGCKHGIPAMLASGGGAIVNIASAAALVGMPPVAAYSASKGAVRALSRTVAVHCLQRGYPIRCNSIYPGGMDTPMSSGLNQMAAQAAPIALELLAKMKHGSVHGPQEVANLVLFLVSDESQHVNGAEISIDGGVAAG